MMSKLLYRMGYHAVFTEFRYADLFAITRSRYSSEFEIKTSKSDLMSELNCVKDLVLFGEPQKVYEKRFKHEHYFKGESNQFCEVPNYFSFVVPFDLEKTALEILKDTKYGLYCIKIHENGGNPFATVSVQKKAQLLHKEKIKDDLLFSLLRKSSTEVDTLRSKLLSTPVGNEEKI